MRVDRDVDARRSSLETAAVYGETTAALGGRARRPARMRDPTRAGSRCTWRPTALVGLDIELRPHARLPLRLHRAAHEPHPAAAALAGDGARPSARGCPPRSTTWSTRRSVRSSRTRTGRAASGSGRTRRRRAVALGLRDARRRDGGKKGHLVPKSALDRGVDYLPPCSTGRRLGDAEDAATRAPGRRDPARPGERTGGLPPEEVTRGLRHRAFVADVLATIGKPDPGYLNRLFDVAGGQTALCAGPACSTPWPPRRCAAGRDRRARRGGRGTRPRRRASAFADEADELEQTDCSTRRHARRPWCCARSSRLDPTHPLAARLARGLLGRREGGAWRSTQENVWALLALDDYRRAQEASSPGLRGARLPRRRLLGQTAFRRQRPRSTCRSPVGTERHRRPPRPALTFQVDGRGASSTRRSCGTRPRRCRQGGRRQRALRAEAACER